jgi:hypothetical protein
MLNLFLQQKNAEWMKILTDDETKTGKVILDYAWAHDKVTNVLFRFLTQKRSIITQNTINWY